MTDLRGGGWATDSATATSSGRAELNRAWLLDEAIARSTPTEELTALELEARRQGVSYGRLVANTDRWDLREIIRAYCAEKKRKEKRGEKADSVAGQ